MVLRPVGVIACGGQWKDWDSKSETTPHRQHLVAHGIRGELPAQQVRGRMLGGEEAPVQALETAAGEGLEVVQFPCPNTGLVIAS
jgi:hypothetical protein